MTQEELSARGFTWTKETEITLPDGTTMVVVPSTHLSGLEQRSKDARFQKTLRLYSIRQKQETVIIEKSELDIDKFLSGMLQRCRKCGTLDVTDDDRQGRLRWTCPNRQHMIVQESAGACPAKHSDGSVCGEALEPKEFPRNSFLCKKCRN